MGKSIDELTAQVQTLSLKKHMGVNVSEEVQRILSMCQSEADKEKIERLCRALGLS